MGTLKWGGEQATRLAALAALLFVALAALPPAAAAEAAPAASAAGNPALVSQIAAQLAQPKGVRAQFRQTQTLAAMTQPLVSTGSLVFLRERGAIWRIDAPYHATYVIDDTGVSEVDPQGRRVNTKRGQGMRGVAQVSRMMRAMLGGDLSALYSQFDVKAAGNPAQWQLVLTPNQPQLAQSMKALQMSGGQYLRTLRITLANGDTTRIDFTNSTAISGLAPAERALLGEQ
jgi:outer membrane lipoprotein-sorting protein